MQVADYTFGMDEHRLQKLFRFTHADLQANRQGRLSPAQQKRLDAEARAEQRSARDSAGILFVIALLGLAFGLILSWFAPTLLSRIFFLGLLCTLWPAAWGWRGWKILSEASALSQARQVQTARGRVHIRREADPDGGAEYILQVDGREFDVEQDPTRGLVAGTDYAVYFLAATEQVLSIEPMPGIPD